MIMNKKKLDTNDQKMNINIRKILPKPTLIHLSVMVVSLIVVGLLIFFNSGEPMIDHRDPLRFHLSENSNDILNQFGTEDASLSLELGTGNEYVLTFQLNQSDVDQISEVELAEQMAWAMDQFEPTALAIAEEIRLAMELDYMRIVVRFITENETLSMRDYTSRRNLYNEAQIWGNENILETENELEAITDGSFEEENNE